MAGELPEWLRNMTGGNAPTTDEPPQNLREYDPEWGDAFVSGRVAVNCDHESMLTHVRVPVLFTHHFHLVDPETGNLFGAISDQQVEHVRRLVESTGNSFTLRSFPEMPHSMHGADPPTYVATITEWLAQLESCPA